MACQVATAFSAAASVSSSRRSRSSSRSALKTRVQLRAQLLLGEVQRVVLGQRDQQPPLVGAVVHQHHFLAPPGGPNWRRRRAWCTAIVSATFDALIEAPPTLTRPWMRVPSIVKNRLVGFSIALT